MINKDELLAKRKELLEQITTAMKSGDDESAGKAFDQFGTMVEENIIEKNKDILEQAKADLNESAMAQRGFRVLTPNEKDFYEGFMKAHKSANPKQALTDIVKAMPKTIIDAVIEDLKNDHPLLGFINFVNCNGAIKMFINKSDTELGAWGAITSAITAEVAGAITEIDMTQAKYTAFIPVPKDLFRPQFGPSWLDMYVRTILEDTVAYGLEKSIVTGDGNGQFIGMDRDTSTATNGAYAQKTAVALKSLDPDAYCTVVANLAKKADGHARTVGRVLLVVNPSDYLKKIYPGSYNQLNGTFLNFPYPTDCVQSEYVAEGTAIMGIASRYFAGIGAGTTGEIEFSDDFQFLEDNRVYTDRIYGMGLPKDNTSFQLLDISTFSMPAIRTKTITA